MLLEPPAPNEIEVSVFGPGYGECILVHLGVNQWLIVDSCVDQRSKRQPALTYLEQIGVDPGSAVRTVLVTHWHTDHVRGISDVVRRCVNAEFWMSQSLRTDELLLATRKYGSDRASKHNAYREFHTVIDTLSVRSEGGTHAPAAGLAGERTLLHRRFASVDAPDCEVVALSPSVASVTDSMAAIAAQLPDAHNLESEYDAEPKPNPSAVVLWVRVGEASIILGSDLENPSNPDRGWRAILASPFQPSVRSAAFKVAHHRSENAHHDDVWTQLLKQNPWAVLTPFRRGTNPLPRASDLERLRHRTSRVYLTAGTRRLRAAPKPKAIRLAMIQSTVSVREEEGAAGHVRLRAQSTATTNEEWAIELKPPARKV